MRHVRFVTSGAWGDSSGKRRSGYTSPAAFGRKRSFVEKTGETELSPSKTLFRRAAFCHEGERSSSKRSQYADGGPRYVDEGSYYANEGTRYADGGSRYVDGGLRYADGGSRYADGGLRYVDGNRDTLTGDCDS